MHARGIVLSVFAGIGVLACIPLAIRTLYFGWLYFLRSSSLPRYLRQNAYALVTGASDGIGKALAHELARRGFNVVIHGRNRSKLDKVQAELQAAFPARKFRVVVANAADGAGMDAAIGAIATELSTELDGPLTVLINNCGGVQPQREMYANFDQLSSKEIDEMVDLNIRFTLQLMRALFPLLDSRGALIMYTGSLAGSVPMPWMTVYAPAKAFGDVWMKSLGCELSQTSPHIECLSVLISRVNGTVGHRQPPSLAAPDAKVMARAALARVGCGQLSVFGYWVHALQGALALSMPVWFQGRTMIDMMAKEKTRRPGAWEPPQQVEQKAD